MKLRKDDENEEAFGRQEMLVVSWENLSTNAEVELISTSTSVAEHVVRIATDHACRACGQSALERLDLGQLATATLEQDKHTQLSRAKA